jgi:hypothetical protein
MKNRGNRINAWAIKHPTAPLRVDLIPTEPAIGHAIARIGHFRIEQFARGNDERTVG